MEVGIQHQALQGLLSGKTKPETSLENHEHNGHGLDKAPEGAGKTGDLLSLLPRNSHKALRILNREMHGALNSALHKQKLPPQAQTELLSPAKFIHKAIKLFDKLAETFATNGQSVREQLHKSLEQGLSDSRQVLHDAGLLDDDMEQAITAAQQQLPAAADTPESTATTTLTARQRSRSLAQSTHLQIQTRDGDVVTIDFSKQRQSTFTSLSADSDQGSLSAMQRENSASQSLSYSVDGDLDDDEQQAIADLMHKVGKLADKFFTGDMDKAVGKALDMGFDTDEIAGFSLALSQQRSQTDTRAVQQTESNQVTGLDALQQNLENFANFVGEFIQTAQSAPAAVLDQPQQSVAELLAAKLQSHPNQLQSTLSDEQTGELTDSLAHLPIPPGNADTQAVADSASKTTPEESVNRQPTDSSPAATAPNASTNPAEPDTAPASDQPMASIGKNILAAVSTFIEVRSMLAYNVPVDTPVTTDHDQSPTPDNLQGKVTQAG